MNLAHDYHDPITGTLGRLVAQRETALKALEAEEQNKADNEFRIKGFQFAGYEGRIRAIKHVAVHGRVSDGRG